MLCAAAPATDTCQVFDSFDSNEILNFAISLFSRAIAVVPYLYDRQREVLGPRQESSATELVNTDIISNFFGISNKRQLFDRMCQTELSGCLHQGDRLPTMDQIVRKSLIS